MRRCTALPIKKRIVWIGEVILDEHLHRTAEIEILQHLAKRGHEVELCAIYSKEKPAFFQEPKILSIPLRSVPLIQRIFFAFILFFFLPLYVLHKKPQIVITEPGISIVSFMWMPLLTKCTKTKTILDVRSTPVETDEWRTAMLGFVFKISVLMAKRLFNGITAVTTLMKGDLAKDFHIDPNFIGVWSNGVSLPLFDPTKHVTDASTLREELGLKNAFVIIYHGAMSSHRGIIESVKSLEILGKGKYGDVVLFLMGNGLALPAIRELVHSSGLQGRVVLHDSVDYKDVPKYLAMSDVGLVPLPNIPDWIHQCPLNLLEYLAMEKPVVVTDIACNRLIVGESKCARYVSNATPAEFAEAIMYFHDRRTTLSQLGSYGRGIVRENYDWLRMAELLDNFFDRS